MQSETVKYFQSLSYEEILAQRPGNWGDYELLEVLQYFEKENKSKLSSAVTELILHSPEHSELVDYGELYLEQMEYERWSKNYPAALRWAYDGLTYEEQHDPRLNRANWYRDIAGIYLEAGALDDGLAIFTRCLEAEPADLWTYNSMGIQLPDVGLSDLAVEVLDWALERYKKLISADPENVSLYFRMGSLLRTIRRYPQSLESFRKGYELGTKDPEDVLNQAMAEHDFGDQAVAKERYEETIRLIATPFTLDSYQLVLVDTARRGLKLLKQGKSSPWRLALFEDPKSEIEPKPSWYKKRRRGRPKKKKGRR